MFISVKCRLSNSPYNYRNPPRIPVNKTSQVDHHVPSAALILNTCDLTVRLPNSNVDKGSTHLLLPWLREGRKGGKKEFGEHGLVCLLTFRETPAHTLLFFKLVCLSMSSLVLDLLHGQKGFHCDKRTCPSRPHGGGLIAV